MRARGWIKRLFAAGAALGAAAAAIAVHPGAAWAETQRRLAVVVGANGAPPGRRPLRYSREDGRRVADVLIHFAGFDPGDVVVLDDPRPRAVLDALDRALGDAASARREAVVLFYYSGHADDRALYPAGEPLRLVDLKARLDDPRAKVRIGIIDACRGGGWTGTKGLAPTAPFDVDVPLGLSNQGSVLIASSSGDEDAHEAESLRGSFFTHHWNGGLRGAADRNTDGRITVGEAFEYARTLTIRDTALVARTPQHPSFLMNMGGRQDFALTTPDAGRSRLVIEQQKGPLELVDLGNGLVVLESAPGRTRLGLGLAPGRYLVRRRDHAGVWAAEVEVPVDGKARIGEERLELVRAPALGAKDGSPGLSRAPAAVSGRWDVGLAFGVRHARVVDPGLRVSDASGDLTGILRVAYGFAPGWRGVLPLAVARAGELGDRWEWVGWGGLPVLGVSHTDAEGATVVGALGAGADLRRWLGGGGGAINLGMSALGAFRWTDRDLGRCSSSLDPCVPAKPSRQGPTSWLVQATVGYTRDIGDVVTLNLAAGASANAVADGRAPGVGLRDPSFAPLVAIGSLQRRGLLPQPLVRVRVGDALSLDVHAVVAYELATRTVTETYMGGATWFW